MGFEPGRSAEPEAATSPQMPVNPGAGYPNQPYHSQPYAPPPYAMPINNLSGRLIALGRSSRSSIASAGYYAVPIGMMLGQTVAIVPLIIWGSSSALTMSSGTPFDIAFPLLLTLLSLLGMAGGAVGGYMLLRYVLQLRFQQGYAQTQRDLAETELPLLVADENYCASLLEKVRDQVKFLFTAPPSSHKLEDQLSIAAAYVQALRLQEFKVDDVRTRALRHGDKGYWSTTAGARTVNLVGSLSFCIPYCSCLSILGLPFVVINILRQAEQKGTLAAICDYFADVPGQNQIAR